MLNVRKSEPAKPSSCTRCDNLLRAKVAERGQLSLEERVIDLVDGHGVADVLDAIAGACYCRSAELVRQEVPKVHEARSWQCVAEAVEEARDAAEKTECVTRS